MKFGAYDSSEETALEDVRPQNGDSSGDFSTFKQLGQEVDSAVKSVVSRHSLQHVEIMLIGHSRGGIAGRQFLQDISYFSRHLYIKGLLTIGTPHQGTPFGKFWYYLQGHPREDYCEYGFGDDRPCVKDWKVVDFLRHDRGLVADACEFMTLLSSKVDVRTPALSYLSDSKIDSPELHKLNSNISDLYVGLETDPVVYGQLRYGGLDLGILDKTFDSKIVKLYSVFDSGALDACPQVTNSNDTDGSVQTESAQTNMLGSKEPSDFKGDGLVPFESQDYINLPGFPTSGVDSYDFEGDENTLHTDELKHIHDIDEALSDMMGQWWTGI